MFYSLVIPDILQACLMGVTSEGTDRREREPASMTVEKSAESQGAETPSKKSVLPGGAALEVTQLYEQFRRPIHSYVYRLLGNQEDADDVTQEVFVRACTSWSGLYEREHLSPWLYRIATNLCVDALRRRKRISWWSLSHRYRNDDNGEEVVNEDTWAFLSDSGGIPEIAEREQIRIALENMPEEYAAVLVLSAAQGVSYQEIASIVGISPNAAATRISRAKRMFMQQYQRLNKEGAGKEENTR